MRLRHWMIIAAIPAATALAKRAGAQGQYVDKFSNVGTYSIAIPLGDTHHFTPDPSYVGLAWEGQWLVHPRTVAGIAVTLNEFYDRTHGTNSFEFGSVTGLQVRELMLVSTMAVGRWYIDRAAYRGIYLGLGAGAQFGREVYQIGTNVQFDRSAVHFVAAPEIGFAKNVSEGMDVVFSARYTGSSAAGNYIGGGSRKFQFLTFSIGMAER